ncbi:hypothetical protein [Sulfurimonas sp.]|uniref:hypothetical protein n=1 Tax=Sulfurimonas sp. TaxID=2022749 RepID=UPI002AB305C2|nr:hypothetical protein [Sulfurimonas sp.]
MLNINELENRRRKYKIKTYLPYGVISLSLIVISSIILILFTSDENKEQKMIQEPKLKKVVIEKIIVKKEVSKIVEEKTPKTKMILSPSLNFMSNIKHNTLSHYENEKLTSLNKQKKERKKVVKRKKRKEKEYIEKINTILIKRQNTQEDIKHVIKRFKKNNNPALSLFVAKKYYELEQYDKSYNYALVTNQINDNIDASWIIFSKSLVKLNQKKEAMKILKKYINYSKSPRAKILLEDIKSGKFK